MQGRLCCSYGRYTYLKVPPLWRIQSACAVLTTFQVGFIMPVESGSIINIEFKARSNRHEQHRAMLKELRARHSGRDHQIDTYFRCARGRLKLREGTVETSLIHYRRPDDRGSKRSDVILHQVTDTESLKAILTEAYGVEVVVEKLRDIYFIDNVKVHLDVVPGLGSFLEVEAIAPSDGADVQALSQQCEEMRRRFGIEPGDMEPRSYSDLMREMQTKTPHS